MCLRIVLRRLQQASALLCTYRDTAANTGTHSAEAPEAAGAHRKSSSQAGTRVRQLAAARPRMPRLGSGPSNRLSQTLHALYRYTGSSVNLAPGMHSKEVLPQIEGIVPARADSDNRYLFYHCQPLSLYRTERGLLSFTVVSPLLPESIS